MNSLIVRRLRTGTLFRLVALGAFCAVVPVFTLFGVLGSMGLATLTWNGQSVVGVRALVGGPLVGLLFALVLTAVAGTAVAFGLWIHAWFAPLRLDYEPLDARAGSAQP